MRMRRGVPTFAPHLPAAWSRFAFRLRVGAAQLQVSVDRAGCHYRLLHGSALALRHRGQDVELSADQPLVAFPVSTPKP